MKAWLLDEQKGIESLRLAEVTDPQPGPGEAVIEVEYAALNPADRYLAEGQYPARPVFPHILGRDAVGRVLSVGADVRSVVPGDVRLVLRGETGVNRPGAFAQRVAVAAESLAPLPAGWTHLEAAGASLVYLTAYQALTQFGSLPPGVVLITGASGGVGVASVHLARAMGHTVVALSRSERKQAELRAMGATVTIDPTSAGWPKTLKSTLSEKRVNLAIDNIGGLLFTQVIETLADRGKLSCVGRLAGPVPEFNTATLFFRRIQIGGVHVGSYNSAEARAAWTEVTRLLEQTGDKPRVDRVFPFTELPAAFRRLQAGPLGKVILAVGGKVAADPSA